MNRTAAEIAAAAFYETFPGVELLGGKRTSIGFSFDFRVAADLPSVAEEIVEEKMRQIIREKRPIRVMEMVPFSARELLLKEGHLARAEELEEGGLVEVIRIGNFYNLSLGPHLSCTSELTAFKLWPMEKLEDGAFRLSGCAYPTKEELKNFLKRLKNYSEIRHEQVGIKKSLWRIMDGQLIWLPQGLERLQEIAQILREHLFAGVMEVVAPHHLLSKLGERVATMDRSPSAVLDREVGLLEGGGSKAFGYFSGNSEEICLQLARKTLTILGFPDLIRPCGRRGMEFLVEDGIGRPWAAFSIERAQDGVFITASVERLVALLIEMDTKVNDIEN